MGLLVLLLAITGCATTKPVVNETIVYKIKKVSVPVPCDAKVECEFKGARFVPTTKLLKCVVKLKRALEYCQQNGSTVL